jgi:hypothetical protein
MPDYLGDFDGHDPIAPSIQFLGQLPLNRRVRLPYGYELRPKHHGGRDYESTSRQLR